MSVTSKDENEYSMYILISNFEIFYWGNFSISIMLFSILTTWRLVHSLTVSEEPLFGLRRQVFPLLHSATSSRNHQISG